MYSAGIYRRTANTTALGMTQQMKMVATVRFVGFVAFKNDFVNVKNRLQWYFKRREACNSIHSYAADPSRTAALQGLQKNWQIYLSGHYQWSFEDNN